MISKKQKKRSSPKFRAIFLPISQVQTYEGGLFSIFHRKSASKAQKTCDFASFTSQWGGLEPPPPPPPGYATAQRQCKLTFTQVTLFLEEPINFKLSWLLIVFCQFAASFVLNIIPRILRTFMSI